MLEIDRQHQKPIEAHSVDLHLHESIEHRASAYNFHLRRRPTASKSRKRSPLNVSCLFVFLVRRLRLLSKPASSGNVLTSDWIRHSYRGHLTLRLWHSCCWQLQRTGKQFYFNAINILWDAIWAYGCLLLFQSPSSLAFWRSTNFTPIRRVLVRSVAFWCHFLFLRI